MLTAHLLAMDSRPEARSRLFGGTAVVPDIPSLQAWLEVAWAAGFDRQGCEQLGGAVQGTHKWIGTTGASMHSVLLPLVLWCVGKAGALRVHAA